MSKKSKKSAAQKKDAQASAAPAAAPASTPAAAPAAAKAPAAPRAEPTPAEISARAHAIWIARGKPSPGTPLEDWVQAERELKA